MRSIGEDPRTILDPGLLDPDGNPLDLARRKNTGGHLPVLFISAATATEAAKERGDHGDFTRALLEKLPNHADKAAISDVFSDIRATVASLHNDQHPQIDGDDRLDKDLFGEPADPISGMITHSITSIRGDSTIVLDKGRVAGLYEGCELTGASPDIANVRIKIVTSSAATSVAELVSGTSVRVPASSRFRLERWVVPEKNPMHFYYEQSAPSLQELTQSVQAISKLEASGVKIVSDPTAEAGSIQQVQVWWMGNDWHLISDNSAKSQDLGRVLDADAILKALRPGAHVFVNFPLPGESAQKIGLGDGTLNDAVELQKPTDLNFSPAYILAGRWNAAQNLFEYAWIRPGVTEQDQAGLNLPVRTDWLPTTKKDFELDLRTMALQLNRIYGWLTLSGPPGDGNSAELFPYKLELRKVGTNEMLKPGESHTVQGEQFKAWVKADPVLLDHT